MKKAVAALREADIPFLLAGSLAVWARGGPETRHDLDFVIKPEDADRALAVLADAGMRTEKPPEEWLHKAWDGDVLIDVIFAPRGLEVTDEVIERGDLLHVIGITIPVMAIEDVLATKLMALHEHELDYTSRAPHRPRRAGADRLAVAPQAHARIALRARVLRDVRGARRHPERRARAAGRRGAGAQAMSVSTVESARPPRRGGGLREPVGAVRAHAGSLRGGGPGARRPAGGARHRGLGRLRARERARPELRDRRALGDDGRHASAVPARRAPPSAAERRGRDRAGQADRAGRPGGQGAHGELEPAARGLAREEVPGARAVAARPDPGGHPRADPRRREVRLAQGLQVLDLRDLLDPPGDPARARQPGSDDPPAGAHRPARAQDLAHGARAGGGARARAHGRGDREGGGHLAARS